MVMENNSIKNDITGDCDRLIQDEPWSENNSEEFSSGNEDINDINSDIDTKSEADLGLLQHPRWITL